jgi:cytochrome c556
MHSVHFRKSPSASAAKASTSSAAPTIRPSASTRPSVSMHSSQDNLDRDTIIKKIYQMLGQLSKIIEKMSRDIESMKNDQKKLTEEVAVISWDKENLKVSNT